MWQRADAILENSTSVNAKFLALIILSEAIRSRWKVLEGGDQARTGIKNFLVQKIIELSSDEVCRLFALFDFFFFCHRKVEIILC